MRAMKPKSTITSLKSIASNVRNCFSRIKEHTLKIQQKIDSLGNFLKRNPQKDDCFATSSLSIEE